MKSITTILARIFFFAAAVIGLGFFIVNILGDDSPDVNYEGLWTASGDSFQNELVLEIVDPKEQRYKFSLAGWRKSYDPYADDIIKFFGEMSDDRFEIQIIDNIGYYTDDTYVDDDEEFPTYLEGEERCKVIFEFDEETIRIKTTACSFIYAGFGVSFDGEYQKTNK